MFENTHARNTIFSSGRVRVRARPEEMAQ